MRRTRLILLVVAAGMLALPALAVAEISTADTAVMREAVDLLKEKRAADALTKLAPLAANLKDNSEFETLYGLTLVDVGKPRDAIALLRHALELDPNNLVARAHLGRAFAAIGDFAAARQQIAAVTDSPNLPQETRAQMTRNLETIDGAIKQQVDQKKQQVAQATANGPAATENDRATMRTAAELVRAKKAQAALAKLDPLADRLAGNPDFDYVYGVAALEAGHPAQAAAALRRALAAKPSFHLARAELGRALAAMGDLSGARREFQTVRDTGGLPVLARDAMGREMVTIDQALTQIQAAEPQPGVAKKTPPPRTVISGYLESSIGYDTNVNQGPNTSTLVIPALAFLGPATILPQAMGQKSGFYELAGGLNVSHLLSDDTAVFANMAGNWHPLFQHDEDFRTAQAGGEAGIAHQVDNLGTFSAAAIGQTFMMGDSVFRNIYGAAGQWRKRYYDAWDTSLSFVWIGQEYPGLIGQNTDRYSLLGAIARKWDQLPLAPSVSFTGTVGKEVARTAGMDFLSFTLLGARVNLETTWTPWLVAFAQVSYEDHQYDADYPMFFVHRHDGLLDALVGLEWRLNDTLSLRPTVHYSDTRSNIGLFDQKRWITSTALRWTF